MNLIYIAALVAVCSAAKLDRTYLPPPSSKTAGGSGDLLTPHFRDSFEPGREGLPKGAEENEFEGVVVEAAAPGTRQSGSGESGLGGPRPSYGSTHSKVGEAAFRIKQQQRPDGNTQGAGQSVSQTSQSFHQGSPSDFNRNHPAAHPSDSQIPNSSHQGSGADQSHPPTPQNFQQGGPLDFNRARPAADQSSSQISHSYHQGASPNFIRPHLATDQSNLQAQQNFNQRVASAFNRPRPAVDQPNFQVSDNFHHGAPSDFNRPRPAGYRPYSQTPQNFHQGTSSNFIIQRPQAAFDRASNTVRIENNVGSKDYNYAYETENGITAGERGVSINGVQAEGGFSYTGDDGKFYKITYTAGEGGYQPVGDHLPTPPPIPDEILKSLEQNAKEEAGGSEDDGSYDAAKYNAEDDYTKSDSSNSQQPVFGKKPESNVDVSGTFINQNNNPFESFPNNNRQEATSIPRFEQHPSIVNNFPSTQDKTDSHDNKLLQNSDTAKFAPSHNEGDATFTQFVLPELEKNVGTDAQDHEFGLDDYSRPINIGSTQFNQVSGNGFGTKQPNHFTQNQATSVQLDTTQKEPSSQRESQGISGSLNLMMKNQNINQQSVGPQDGSQILSHSDNHINKIEFSKNPNIPEKQLSSFPSIHSTLQPSLELTTPYEYSSYTNHGGNVHYQNQDERGSPRPTQQSFSPQVTSDLQSSILTNSEFITPNTDANLQLHNSNLQKDSKNSQQLPFVEQQTFNVNSQNNPIQDKPYYYHQPSVTFNPYSRPTIPTFTYKQSGNRFGSSFPTKYPRPPTVATTFASRLPERNMYNQNSNIPQSFIPQNNAFGGTTKYPQPPSLVHNISAPISPTTQSGDDFFTQHTGLTQASVSPFPSISPSKQNSNSNYQPIETTHQNILPNSEANKFQQEVNDNPESNANAPIDEKNRPGQQYDGEVYEYQKPTETLITPTESDETIQRNGFPQFGQKLKPSTSQTNSNFNQINKQNEYNKNQKYPSSQGSTSSAGDLGTKPLTQSQNFQPQFSLQSTPELNNEGFNKDNRRPIVPPSNTFQSGDEQPTQSSQISSDTFTDVQTTADYNGPFGFSSRIRPCCQGPRRIPISKTPDRQAGNNFQNSGPFGHQNANLRPEFGSGKPVNTQSTGILNNLQNAQTTSQSLITVKGEEFDGARQPPRFDETSGYHYK